MTTPTPPEVAHTPTPWKAQPLGDHWVVTTPSGYCRGQTIAQLLEKEDAAHIVQCVNERPALLAENAQLRKALEAILCDAQAISDEWLERQRTVGSMGVGEVIRSTRKLAAAALSTPDQKPKGGGQ